MKPDRYQQVCEIFVTARSTPPEERSAYLDDACVGDTSLREEVESLLANDDAATHFLDNPVLGDDFLNHVPPSRSTSANRGATDRKSKPRHSPIGSAKHVASGSPRNDQPPSPTSAAGRQRSKNRTAAILTIICIVLLVVVVFVARQARHLSRLRDEAQLAADTAKQEKADAAEEAALIALDAAAVAIRANEVAAAQRYLASVPEPLRDAHWQELFAETDQSVAVLDQHDGEVLCVACSPDGRVLASAAIDGTIRLWDAETNRLRRTLLVEKAAFSSVAFAPSNRSLIAGTLDGTIRVFDLDSGDALASWEAHQAAIRCVCYAPDGLTFASASDDKTVRIWDAASHSETLRIDHPKAATSVVFSPDGKRIASGCRDGIVRIRQLDGAASSIVELHADLAESPETRGTAVAFSPYGDTLSTSTATGIITLWDSTEHTRRLTIVGTGGEIRGIAFTPDGKYLAAGLSDTTLRLWDTTSGSPVATLRGHTGAITSIACMPNGEAIATSSSDTTIRVWRISRANTLDEKSEI